MGKSPDAPRPPRGARAPAAPPAAIDALAARVAHLERVVEDLERVVEGLQDAMYRQNQLHDRDMAELRRRTEPAQIAQDLSRDARERGL
jgi:hypothetical protein